MTKYFLNGGRMAWPPVLAALFSTVMILATDYAWRMVQGGVTAIALSGVLLLVAGNALIFVLARKAR